MEEKIVSVVARQIGYFWQRLALPHISDVAWIIVPKRDNDVELACSCYIEPPGAFLKARRDMWQM